MLILNTRLFRSTFDLSLAAKTVKSFGVYRWKLLYTILKSQGNYNKEIYNKSELIIFRFCLVEIMWNIELEKEFTEAQIQWKKEINSYQGLRLHLSLPVNGQWTWTNASTQRLLNRIPRKRHFLQRKNWRKFTVRDQKKSFQKLRNIENEKK